MRAWPYAGSCCAGRGNDCRWVRSRCRLRPDPSCLQAAAPAAPGVPVAAVSQTSLYQPAAPAAVISPPATSTPRAMASATASGGGWAIQVGAFRSPVVAREAATGVHDAIPDLLAAAQIELLPTTPFGGAVIYRARLGNLSSADCQRSLRPIGGGPAALHGYRSWAGVVARCGCAMAFIEMRRRQTAPTRPTKRMNISRD